MLITQDVEKLINQKDVDFYHFFRGKVISSQHIENLLYDQQRVAIVGTDQNTANQLMNIAKVAKSVAVFQLQPTAILPKSKKIMADLPLHPLIRKNKSLFNERIKSFLALIFLEKEVKNIWLRSQLTANFVQKKLTYLKSDDYYSALQFPQCQLNIWPISHVGQHHIYTINGDIHFFDIIIYTK